MEKQDYYPGFKHKASELSAFAVAVDTFIISLKNGKLTRFTPEKPGAFRTWLNYHNIRDADKSVKNDIKQITEKPKPKRKWRF